jgi:predicted outer membrane protein
VTVEVRQLVGWGGRAIALAALVALVPTSAALAANSSAGPAEAARGASMNHAGMAAGMSHSEHMAAMAQNSWNVNHAKHMAAMLALQDQSKLRYLAPSRGPEKDLPIPVPPDVAVSENGKFGPIGPADVDLVVKVRLAGLWEQPAGEMAEAKGKSPRVREIGKMIAEQHAVLDQLDVRAAQRLGIQLPNEPNADQKYWLQEMKDAEGDEFDRIFVDRLRAAHGKVFSVIALVRSGTRNDLVRELAQQSNQFVGTHLTLLESTSLVDWQHLPLPPEPPQGPVPAAGWIKSGVSSSVILLVLGAALVAGTVTTLRVLRPR